MVLGQLEPRSSSSYFLRLRLLLRQDVIFEELHNRIYPARAYSDLMNMDHAFGYFICFVQVLDENNSRQIPCRGGGKRGQRICMSVSTSGDVRQAEKVEAWL